MSKVYPVDQAMEARRNQRWEEFRRIEETTFSVFVDNLPGSMTLDWLRQMFEFEGKISDIYMSRRRRRMSNAPFAFVRFYQKGEAERAIKNLHGLVIRGHKLRANEAKYK